jgi:hypothetical protein
MPASIVAELLQPVLEAVFHVVCYCVGRVAVPVISFGRWKCDGFLRDVPRKKLRRGGIYQLCGQQVYLTAEATALVGFMVCGLVIAGFLWWYLSAR